MSSMSAGRVVRQRTDPARPGQIPSERPLGVRAAESIPRGSARHRHQVCHVPHWLPLQTSNETCVVSIQSADHHHRGESIDRTGHEGAHARVEWLSVWSCSRRVRPRLSTRRTMRRQRRPVRTIDLTLHAMLVTFRRQTSGFSEPLGRSIDVERSATRRLPASNDDERCRSVSTRRLGTWTSQPSLAHLFLARMSCRVYSKRTRCVRRGSGHVALTTCQRGRGCIMTTPASAKSTDILVKFRRLLKIWQTNLRQNWRRCTPRNPRGLLSC